MLDSLIGRPASIVILRFILDMTLRAALGLEGSVGSLQQG